MFCVFSDYYPVPSEEQHLSPQQLRAPFIIEVEGESRGHMIGFTYKGTTDSVATEVAFIVDAENHVEWYR